jgi:serine/threonine protein kinase
VSLSAGTRLGSYDILVLLGAGGMGEVYRARDTKLGRDVALKILPELFAADAEVRAGSPKVLFERSYGNGFDVAPDGKRFLMIKSSSSAPTNQVAFIVNWFEVLKARVPAK